MEKNKYEDNEKWVATSGGGLSGGLGNDYKDRQGILGEWEKRNEASEASSDLLCVTNGSIDLHLTHSLSILGFSPSPTWFVALIIVSISSCSSALGWNQKSQNFRSGVSDHLREVIATGVYLW